MSCKIRNVEDGKWFWIDNDFIDRYRGYLRQSCVAVYMSLCHHADNETQTCYPPEEVIAIDAGVTSRTVQKCIKTLKELNIISVTSYQGELGRWPNNTYTLINRAYWKRPEETISYGKKGDKLFKHPKENKDISQKKLFPTNNTDYNKTSNIEDEKADLYKNINSFRNKNNFGT